MYSKKSINNVLGYEKVRDLMTDKKIGLTINHSAMLFGLSKMTVVNESGANVSQHFTIKLVEFIEFIARTAAQIFGGFEDLA